ncbi:uncharacterized protein LOC112177546 [Rosa chinensis]|uniref:uncharacterized protein LOC112177545 n=1 Tax=Rosa chinensis TaxID=74649 RepID=UPI000D090959|nr:uncharacterized protein LOC112177545 [Rosa chinensis]XP_024171597.1 uncharacterized protein LOC112177546 [Rosa chinensis]
MVGMLTDEETEDRQPWTLFFDGSATSNGGGAGVVLIDPAGNTKALSFKLGFPCTNNTAEYEAFIIGMSTAVEMGMRNINIIGDSNLVISQMRGNFAVKEAALAPYRTLAQKLIRMFDQTTLEHIPGSTSRYADALATLGSKLLFTKEQPNVMVTRKSKPSIEALALPELPEEDDWRKPIISSLICRSKRHDLKNVKEYMLLHKELYKRLSSGVLARCICEKEAKQKLSEVHEATCGLEQVAACSKCSVLPLEGEVLITTTADDWRTPYFEFLLDKVLPTDANLRYKLMRTSKRYFMDGGVLYRRGFNGKPLRCLGAAESQQVLEEMHAGECGEHQGKRKLYRQLLSLGYHWPTMQKDAHLKVKKCHSCQAHANQTHKPSATLQDMRTPWPFHTWGLDFVGKINPASNGHGIPYKIVTDNGTPFVNQEVSKMLRGYGIKHRKSTPYYPQGNGQAEATNKTLLRILSKMVFEYEQGWSTHLPDALWAYRTSPRTATGFSPYSLVYGSEAISPVELAVPTARILTVNDTEWDAESCSHWRLIDLEAADE